MEDQKKWVKFEIFEKLNKFIFKIMEKQKD